MRVLRPMLAARADDPSDLCYPCLATPKVDGIRCLVVESQLVSRAFKPIRNRRIVEALSGLPEGADGELVAADGTFQDTQSMVMSEDGDDDFELLLFDVASELPYQERATHLKAAAAFDSRVVPLVPKDLWGADDLLRYEERCLEDGHEGVVARSPGSPYKFGRSTLREGYMVKFKRRAEGEATIVGFVEQMQNNNPIQRNAFGRVRRPGGRSLHTPKGTLGALQVVDCDTGVRFEIGTGFDDALRRQLWDDQPQHIGRVVRYSHQSVGADRRPRFPSFQGFREVE